MKTKGVHSCNALKVDLKYNKHMNMFVITIIGSIQMVSTCSLILERIKRHGIATVWRLQ